MTFSSALGWHASTTAFISSSTSFQLPSLAAPMLITMSISLAPFSIASLASYAFASVSIAPRGKPTTQQVETPLSLSSLATSSAWQEFTHTLAKSYFFASSHIFFICSVVASGLRRVWSMYLLSFIIIIHIPFGKILRCVIIIPYNLNLIFPNIAYPDNMHHFPKMQHPINALRF